MDERVPEIVRKSNAKSSQFLLYQRFLKCCRLQWPRIHQVNPTSVRHSTSPHIYHSLGTILMWVDRIIHKMQASYPLPFKKLIMLAWGSACASSYSWRIILYTCPFEFYTNNVDAFISTYASLLNSTGADGFYLGIVTSRDEIHTSFHTAFSNQILRRIGFENAVWKLVWISTMRITLLYRWSLRIRCSAFHGTCSSSSKSRRQPRLRKSPYQLDY